MSGREGLRFVQLGREATAGTGVAATSVWKGTGLMKEDQQLVFPAEDVGVFGNYDNSYIPYSSAAFTMDAAPASFEQLPHILDAAIGEATPAADGIGTGYVYTYTLAESSEATPQTYTIEAGDDTQCEELDYGIVSEFGLAGASKEAIMVNAEWFGQEVATATKTADLEPPDVSVALFGKTSLYIEAIDGTPGSTIKAATLMGYKLNVKTGFMPLYSADGQVYMASYYQTDPEPTLELTLLHNTIGRAQIDAMLAQTPQLFQLVTQGPALATPGTDYTYKTLAITCAGKYEAKPELAAQDGNNIITLTVNIKRNTGSSNFASKRLEIVVVNELGVMP